MRKSSFFLIFLTVITAANSAQMLPTAWGQAQTRQNTRSSQRIDLVESKSTSEIISIKTQLVGAGQAMPTAEQNIPLRLKAEFQYDERVIARQKALKSLRDYQIAKAEIQLGSETTIREVAGLPRLIVNQASHQPTDTHVSTASIGTPLAQEELELIDTPANSLVAAQLVTKNQVAIGDTWSPSDEALARFLNLDIVTTNEVQLTFQNLQRGIAIIECQGQLIGYVDDAKTEMSLEGTLQFDVEQGRMRGLLITMNQKRSIGQIAPGLEAVFKVQSLFEPLNNSPRLSNEAIAQLRETASITAELQLVSAAGTFSLHHDRNWRVISNQTDRTTLRYLQQGKMMGQCDIISLPPQAADQAQTLAQFRAAVEKNIQQRGGSILDMDQATTSSGLSWLRVDAAGIVDDVNLHWSYYTVTDPTGQRLQMIFTTEPENSQAFLSKDRSLLERIAFRKTTREASLAKPSASASALAK